MEVHFRLGKYFEARSHKTAISLPDLVEQTNSFSVKNRPGCKPALIGSKPKELLLDYNVKCNLSTSDPNGHDVRIRFDLSEVKDESTAKALDVAVRCTCPAFLYWGAQWNAHQRDALEGEPRPLLTAPTERRDLRDKFVICKHVKAVSERILPSVQHNINNILRERRVEEAKKREPVRAPNKRREEQQILMRERMRKRKEKEKREKDVRKKLEQGIKRRTPDAKPGIEDSTIERTTPATEGEQQQGRKPVRLRPTPEPVEEKGSPLLTRKKKAPVAPEPKTPTPEPLVTDEPEAPQVSEVVTREAPALTTRTRPRERRQMEQLFEDTEPEQPEKKPARAPKTKGRNV